MRKIRYLLCSLLFPALLFSQELTKDNLIDTYLEDAGLYAALYHGKGYVGYPRYYINHPCLVSPEYQLGDLKYGDVYYPEVYLKLDWFSGQVIVNTPDRIYQVLLAPERFEYATIHGYKVIYHPAGELPGNLPEGYYLHLHEGTNSVLKLEIVVLDTKVVDSAVEYKFMRSTRYYVLQNGKYNRIGGQQSLLSLFPIHKKELKRFIKQNGLSYKEDSEKLVLEVVKHYETLIQ
ncbi:MAG: hypothetical protein LIP01_07230 [Tannerellaceae bacterium]|nr:hypothetical protein [Tannerellaceae bacterium]